MVEFCHGGNMLGNHNHDDNVGHGDDANDDDDEDISYIITQEEWSEGVELWSWRSGSRNDQQRLKLLRNGQMSPPMCPLVEMITKWSTKITIKGKVRQK